MVWKSVDTIPLNKEILVIGDAYNEGGNLWYSDKIMLVRCYIQSGNFIRRNKNRIIFVRKRTFKKVIRCVVAHTYYYELEVRNIKCWTEIPERDVETT